LEVPAEAARPPITASVRTYIRTRTRAQVLFERGECGSEMFLLTKGSVAVTLAPVPQGYPSLGTSNGHPFQ
jgi:hypothetical protein